MDPDTCVILPAYKPPEEFVQIVEALGKTDFRAIIVVDDSGPSYEQFYKRIALLPKVHLIRRAQKLGKGSALKAAFDYGCKNFPDCPTFITADADGQHLVSDIINVAECADRNKLALVIGVRTFGDNTPLRSKVGNTLSTLAVKLLVGLQLSDTTSGLRAIPRAFAERLVHLETNGYEFELDMVAACKHLNIKLVEQPISTVYINNNEASHFNPVLDSLRIYGILSKFVSRVAVGTILNIALFALLIAVGVPFTGSEVAAELVSGVVLYSIAASFLKLSEQSYTRAVLLLLATTVVHSAINLLALPLVAGALAGSFVMAKVVCELVLLPANTALLRDVIFTNPKPALKPVPERQAVAV